MKLKLNNSQPKNLFRTTENTAAASFCDSPYHLSTKFDTCKLINRAWAARARALAIRVLPQPGGP